jgi:hypothetical protein
MAAARSSRRAPLGVATLVLIVVAATLALAALLDLGPFSDEAGQLTKSDFIARADSLCKRAHDQFAELQPSQPATSTEAADLQRKLIAISEAELADIRDLGAPADVQPALDRYLRAREQGIALMKKGLAAAERDDAFAYAHARQQLAATQRHRTELAQDVGFRECSSSFGGVSG